VDNLKPGRGDPVHLRRADHAGKLKDIFPEAKPDEIREALAQLKAEYEQTGRAFSLEEIAGGYQLLTRSQHADIIAKLKKAKADRKLSAAALETLAIIAYKQPIKRVDWRPSAGRVGRADPGADGAEPRQDCRARGDSGVAAPVRDHEGVPGHLRDQFARGSAAP
jgi:hypothetical protein